MQTESYTLSIMSEMQQCEIMLIFNFRGTEEGTPCLTVFSLRQISIAFNGFHGNQSHYISAKVLFYVYQVNNVKL